MAEQLMKVQGTIVQPREVRMPLTVGTLLARMSAHFPREDGEPWDAYGLSVGDERAQIDRVAVALDATRASVSRAAEAGANVLVTHHPVFLDPPECISPGSALPGSGSVLWEAATRGVAVMSFHTALDAQPAATKVLPDMLGLVSGAVFKPLAGSSDKGYGRICTLREDDPLTLGTLAARCNALFARPPRVWGDFATPLARVVTWPGSLGQAVEQADIDGLDAIVCGEVKYHTALALAEAGVGIIEVGHDVSELPYALLIAQTLGECGVESSSLVLLDRGPHWSCPDAIRM